MAELIWDGKYDANGKRVGPVRVALPFQTVETVNESAQERDRSLFAEETPWRNRLIWGDKKYVLPSLLPEFAGKVDLIYIDPPFNTNSDFSFSTAIPGADEELDYVPSAIERKAYRDTWGASRDVYLKWLNETLLLLRELLSDKGSIYIHLDQNEVHYAKCLLDEVFLGGVFRSEIIWRRTTAHSDAETYGASHDTILFYTKSKDLTFTTQFQPYTEEYKARFTRFDYKDGKKHYWTDDNLTAKGLRGGGYKYTYKGCTSLWRMPVETMERLDKEGRLLFTSKGGIRLKRYLDDLPGLPAQDLWADINPVNSQAAERVNYATQKPEALLQRIISASSKEGELVLDCFCGSGTTAAVAEKLGRKWITCDLGRFAIHTTRKRLLKIPDVKPFIVQNLGKYERSQWQEAEFGDSYAVRLQNYQMFIIQLFKGQHRTGNAWVHGTRKGRLVHVGAVDAPVTLADVRSVAAEARKMVGTGEGAPKEMGIDVLFWDLAFEVNEAAKQIAKEAGIDLKVYKIPNEVMEKKAVDQGDIQFHELAALGVKFTCKERTGKVELTEFVMSLDYVPDDVRQSVTHWSQWVDYWAIDWDFQGDTFHNQWQAYRTKAEPKLPLTAEHHYDKPGEYRILVKVIDLLGNDTTKSLRVTVQ